MAALQAEMGRHGEAIATYNRLIVQAGDAPRVRRQILQLYFRLGDETGIRHSLEALTVLEPAEPAPYRLLGQLYLQTDRQQEALQAFEQAYDIDPNDLETVLALTDLYRQLGREADAARLDQATDVESASLSELMARATALYEQADTDAEARQNATHLLERALTLEPDNPDALLMLGTVRFQAGFFAEAAPCWNKPWRKTHAIPPLAPGRSCLPPGRAPSRCLAPHRRRLAALSRPPAPAPGSWPQLARCRALHRGAHSLRGCPGALRRGVCRRPPDVCRDPYGAGLGLL